MPVSAELLKALAEDPKSLEHQLGCMAGLFQIFDRQGLGRRYGSKRVSNAGSGQSQPTSACETPRHHHHLRGSNNPYWMFEEESSRFEARNVGEPHHRPAYSDSSEMFTKSTFETPTESRDEKSSQSPMYSEESSSVIGGLASWDPASSFEHPLHGDELKQLNMNNVTVVPVRAQQQQQQSTTSDIRDIVRASFERDHQQQQQQQQRCPLFKEKPRLSVDINAAGSHGYLKNLPRSASVDGKDRSSAVDHAIATRLPAGTGDLPRSSSVGGRGASRMLADWKDGLRSSSGSPRLTSRERDALLQHKQQQQLLKGENNPVTRLTVELKEGPRLSVSVDDRRASVDASPRPASRFRDEPDFNRAADIKEFLRGEKKAGRVDGHRFSVDGTRDAPRACNLAPRLSVDGRDEGATRKANHPHFGRQSSGRKASNVVARLMGLEDLLPLKETRPRLAKLETTTTAELYDQAFLQLHNHPEFSPPPPPSPPDDYDYAHHAADHEPFRAQSSSIHDHFKHHQQLQVLNCQAANTPPLQLEQPPSPPYKKNFKTVVTPEQAGTGECIQIKPGPQSGDGQMTTVRKSPQGRRSLWHIFEAMQLKGLLQGSSRRKQAEALKLHNLKMTEKSAENDDLQRSRSQSLPPLRLSSSKDPQSIHTPNFAPHASDLDLHEPANADDDDDDAMVVVVKPIITARSTTVSNTASSQAAPPLPSSSHPSALKMDGARKYHPDEQDSTPKIMSRQLSKSVHRAGANAEPEPAAESANARQSRKERGAAARMTKSFSDVPQLSEQSLRCARLPSQERPARSCSPRGESSSVSPRCPAGNNNVMDSSSAGKMQVRGRKAFAVKDREESKASLAHLRATATKQEFLKERASGDPDTPRLLRRSSSESKLLSKINAEMSKPDTVKATVRPAAATPLQLRSKKSVPVPSKDTVNKSPMKTRPTMKPVAKPSMHSSQVVHKQQPPAKTGTLLPLPAESKAASEVRATPGGALDQSGDHTSIHAASEGSDAAVRTLESKAQEKSIELLDEGVKTPRGVSIKKIDFCQEDAQAEVAEQPSPVSVLDNSHFDEELTPSPKAGKSSSVQVSSLQEQSLQDRRWTSARFLDLDLEHETTGVPTQSVTLKVPESCVVHRHRLRVCLKDADEESRYVEDLVDAAELCSSPSIQNNNNNYVMDPTLFDEMESKRGGLVDCESDDCDALDRRILFDCVNELLERVLETERQQQQQQPWWRLFQLRNFKRPLWGSKQLVVTEVLTQLEDIPCTANSDDVCDTVYVILQKDLLKRGQHWTHYRDELDEVGVAVERLIVKDLIEDTVRDLLCFHSSASPASLPAESSRRQLFA